MDFGKIMQVSAAGLKAQSARMRVIAENVANSDRVAETPGADPYRRKIVTFRSVLDRTSGVRTVEVNKVRFDNSAFGRRYDPGHPGADTEGFVRTPNVKTMIEMMDMRAAQRSYEANLSVIQLSRAMLQNALDILR